MTDAQVYDDAQSKDLHIPDGKYYLTDAGFPMDQQLLVLYHGAWYHLKEWGCTSVRYNMLYIYLYNNYRPANKEELFNLHHASLCNVKWIFGVLK